MQEKIINNLLEFSQEEPTSLIHLERKTKRILLSLQPTLHLLAKKQADRMGIPLCEFICQALELAIREEEKPLRS